MSEEKLVPKLRFVEFDDYWVEKNLGDILYRRKEQHKISKDTPLLAFAAGQGVIDRSERKSNNRDFLTKDSENKTYLLTKYDDIVYNPSNLKYGAIDRNSHGRGVISPIYVTFESKISPLFMEYIVKDFNFQQKALKYEEGTVIKRQSVHPKDLVKIKIKIPKTEDEQIKIATFLSLIDQKTELLEKKYNDFLNFKKYLMQQIFTQKLRFDFNEKWKVYKLKDLFSVKSSNISINKVDNNMGEYPLYGTGGYLQNIDFYEMEDEYISITKDGSVGKIDYHEGRSSIINTSQYLIPNKNFNIRFLYYQLQTLNFEKYIVGSSIPHIYFKDYGNEKVKIPNLLEQEIIAKLFIVIDKKLYMLDKSISLMYRFKKGLLQQMFI